METGSWWIEAQRGDRSVFYARLAQEAARLQKLTTDPRLQPRGPEVKPAVRGGRTPTEE